MTLYDFSYIDDKIIGSIEKNLPNCVDIIRTIEKRATGKTTSNLGGSMGASADVDFQKMSSMGDTTYQQAPMLAVDDSGP